MQLLQFFNSNLNSNFTIYRFGNQILNNEPFLAKFWVIFHFSTLEIKNGNIEFESEQLNIEKWGFCFQFLNQISNIQKRKDDIGF